MANRPINNSINPPKVSVIMNCLNCEKYVGEAIDSVYGQTYKDWEIIFWDNASTDRSGEIACSYDNRLRYFRGEKTVPLGEARNKALQQARGQFIAFLDCDDIWLPEKLKRQIPLFKNERVGLVFSNAIYFNDNGESRKLYGIQKPPRGLVFRELLTKYFLPMPTVVIRKSVLDSLDEWFDERFNICEDADLFLRIAYNNDVDYVDVPLAKWRAHKENWTFTTGDLVLKENRIMLKKFRTIYKDFEKQFKREILLKRGDIQYNYALADWKKGKKRLVRKRLYPYLQVSKRFWVPYVFSFLSYKVYKQFLSLYTMVMYGT